MTDLNDDIIELTDIVNKNSDLPTDEYVIELNDIVKDETTNFDLEIEKEDEFELEISDSKDTEQIDDEFTDDIFEDDDVEDKPDDESEKDKGVGSPAEIAFIKYSLLEEQVDKKGPNNKNSFGTK